MLKRNKYFLLILTILLLSFGTSQASHGKNLASSILQLNGPEYTVGTDQDGAMLDLVKAEFPDARKEYFSDKTGGYAALLSGKIDAFVENRYEADYDLKNGLKGVKILPGSLGEGVKISAGLSKTSSIPGLEEKFNSFIARSKSEGLIDSMIKRWVYGSAEMPDIDVPEKSDVRLTLGTTGLVVPFSFYASNKITGFDVELARRFAASIGAELEIRVYDFGGLLMALSTGEVDIALSNLYYSHENAGSLKFSDVMYTVEPVVIVREDMYSSSGNGDFSAFNGKRIGVFTGSVQYEMVKEKIPGAEISYFDSMANIMTSLTSGKIDAAALDETIIAEFERANPDVMRLNDSLGDSHTGFLFPKSIRNNPLIDEINEYLRQIKSDGTLNEIRAIWSGTDESKKIIPDYSNFPATKGTLQIAVDNETALFSYMKNGKLVGHDVDLLVRFCREKGYKPEFKIINFTGLIAAVSARKCDIGAGGITITPERAESVNFSEPVFAVSSFLMIKKPAAQQSVVKRPTISDFNGKIIAANSGTLHPDIVMEVLPKARLLRFDGDMNVFTALMNGKADAAVEDEIILRGFLKEHGDYEFVDGFLKTFDNGFIFAKTQEGSKLRDEFNEYLNRIKSDGTLQSIYDLWFGDDESVKELPDYEAYPDTNGVIDIAVYAEVPPMDYVKNGRPAGYEPDIAVRFCKDRGYRPRITIGNFDSIIPAVLNDRAKIGLAVFTITEERKESVNFSDSIYTGGSRLIVPKKSARIPKYSRLSELDGKPVGMQPGILDWEEWVAKNLPHSKVHYYNTYPDLASALKSHKIEGFLVDSPVLALMAAEDDKLAAIDEPVGEIFGYSFGFAKTEAGKKLSDEMSQFIRKLKASGELDAILSKWQGSDETVKVIADFKSLPATNGTLTFAIEGSYPPFNYYKGTKIAGIDVDIAVKFCEAYGYGLNVTTVVWDAMIPGLISGKVDFVPNFTPSPEHEEAVNYSEPYCQAYSVMACLKADENNSASVSSLRLSDFQGKNVGLMIGSDSAKAIEDKIPGVKILFFDSPSQILPSLRSHRIDAFYCAEPTAKNIIQTYNDLAYVPEYVRMTQHTTMFPSTEKGRKLCGEYADFLKALTEDGTMDILNEKWITGTDESKQVTEDYSNLPATNGTLTMAVTEGLMPFVFAKDNRIQGYDIDLAVMFCKAKGCGLKIDVMNHNGVLSSLQTGKCDFSYSVQWTEERDKTMLFSPVPNAVTGSVLVVLKQKSVGMKLSDFSTKRIGVPTATSNAEIVEEVLPDAELVYFDSPAEMLPALRQGKIDAFSCAVPTVIFIMDENHDIEYISEPLKKSYHSATFTPSEKGRRLRDEYSAFVKNLWEDGTIDKLFSKWFKEGEEARKTEDYSKLPAVKGTLRMAVDVAMIPFVYIRDNRVQGYDIDLAVMFCKAEGYGLELVPISRLGALEAVKSGKCDFSYAMAQTEEREKSVVFASVPNSENDNVLVVLKPVTAQSTKPADDEPSFFEELDSSFEKTFVREERWRLFAEGILNTMTITILSIFFGILLGFTAFMFCRTGSRIANAVTKFSVWLIKGTPNVVLLMILYYIIFGHVNISGIVVSIIAFTLTFGTSVYRMLTFGTGAVDNGQTEAAYALGFTDLQTFFTVVLPQAALHFMPSLREEVTLLIKSTSIVGYIAVQDLTKMGDIVRSRTYEAFFPLIAVALIYFVLAGILNSVVTVIQTRITPSKRKPVDILKGIDTKGVLAND